MVCGAAERKAAAATGRVQVRQGAGPQYTRAYVYHRPRVPQVLPRLRRSELPQLQGAAQPVSLLARAAA
eukprot:scaffold7789_cov376-Prasinococcus_capsulatus_cf.AAC.7